jgi:ketosteroid isomerase-like protein
MGIRSTLRELCEAFNAHDLDRVMAFFSDDVAWRCRGEASRGVLVSRANRTYAKRWQHVEGLPDVHYGNAEHFVDSTADTGISKWTLTGTTREGTRLEVRGCDFYTFRDDKVIRKDSYWKIVE